ncbi:MAG: MGMT family protein [Candidatus Dormibacteria bacterium]
MASRRTRHGLEPRETLAEAVARVLQGTVPGEVLSYSQLARLAGRPGAARAVGRELARSQGLPWWRVVHQDGTLAAPKPALQARLLREEGIEPQRLSAARRGSSHRQPERPHYARL